jgi:hypothetical protein
MPVDGHITTEGILRFCSAESASSDVRLILSSYRDLLAEEKLPLVANHPKGSQKLLPSIVPALLQEPYSQNAAAVALILAWAIEQRSVRPPKAETWAACNPKPFRPSSLPYSIWQ